MAEPEKSSGSMIGLILFGLVALPVSLVLILTLQVGFIFIVFGLMPAMVAYFVDGFRGKPTFKCVLSCNLAGMIPTFTDVARSDSMATTIQMLMAEPFTWFTVYGAAACGYGLLLTTRIIAQIGQSIADEQSVQTLKKKQDELVEEWGDGVKVLHQV